MIELEEVAEGILLPVQAQARARKNSLAGVHAGRLKVAVTQAPEKGKANAAILKVLAAELGLKRSQLHLHAGQTSPQKKVLVTGMSVGELRARIAASLPVSGGEELE